jgi:hypothetical protein
MAATRSSIICPRGKDPRNASAQFWHESAPVGRHALTHDVLRKLFAFSLDALLGATSNASGSESRPFADAQASRAG